MLPTLSITMCGLTACLTGVLAELTIACASIAVESVASVAAARVAAKSVLTILVT